MRLCLQGRYTGYARRFRDVHERNVVFEARHWRRPGIAVLARDEAGRVSLVRVRLRPIDVRRPAADLQPHRSSMLSESFL